MPSDEYLQFYRVVPTVPPTLLISAGADGDEGPHDAQEGEGTHPRRGEKGMVG